MFRRDSIVTTQPMSLGGNTGTAGSSLFGGNTASTQNQSLGGSLFGGSNTTAQNQPAGGGLFGSNTTNQNQQAGGGLFGASNTTQNQPTGGGLFGGSTTTQNQPTNTNTGGGLFGGVQPAANTGTSLFGSAQPAANPAPSLFGATQNQQPPTNTSLFGGTQNQQPAASNSLFGVTQNQPPPTAANATPSLFQPSALNRTLPPQTHLSTLLQSGLNNHPGHGALVQHSQNDLARSRLESANIAPRTNEKPILAQIQTLIRKWDPHSTDTLMQTWLYNAVNSVYAPFYHRNVAEGEDEEGWEKALSDKPPPVKSEDGSENISFVPVLVRGFHALGQRIEYQARTVNEMRARLHEMNNSLDAVLTRHSQTLTVRLENARRQHAALRQRCLRLAVKAQILRQRGFPLDGQEEALRKQLVELEKGVFDPAIKAREEEIWARLVVLRERGRWLVAESERVGAAAAKIEGTGVSEEVLKKTRAILRDYREQLESLEREVEEVKKQFAEYEGGR